MRIFFLMFVFLNICACGCPDKTVHKPIKQTDLMGYPNLSTVPDFPKNYPTQADWDKIREDLHPEETVD